MPAEWCAARARVVVDLLKVLDIPKGHDVGASEFASNGSRISALLHNVEREHGADAMVAVLAHAQRELGHTPGPLSSEVVRKLHSNGVKIAGVDRALARPPPAPMNVGP